MKLNPEDPRLTAYALGELEPAERAAIEAELQNNPECRRAVEEIRGAANTLSSELAAEPCPGLRPEQRASIKEQLQPANVIVLPRRPWMQTAGIAAIAASILAVVAWQLWMPPPTKPGAEMARLNQPHPASVANPAVAPIVVTETTPGVTVVSAPPAEPSRSLQAFVTNGIVSSSTATQPTPPVAVTSADFVVKGLSDTKLPDTARLRLENAQVNGNTPVADGVSAPTGQPGFVFQTTAGTQGSPGVDQKTRESMQQANADSFNANLGQTQSARRAGARGATLASGGNGGRAGGGMGGAGGGGRASLYRSDNYVVVTEYRRAVQYDDPMRGDFAEWRYYRVPPAPRPLPPPVETANYERYVDNEFLPVSQYPLSTFSTDVDTASYANVRRFLNSNRLPPPDAVRIEEMVNYFTYHYTQPKGEDPFAASIEVAGCPWNTDHRLVRVGIKGREIAREKRPPSNLVFLIDISGSMQPAERLPLIKQALRQLVKQMGEGDRVAIVVYASEAGVRLASTPCTQKEKILEAIDALTAGGSTNGGEGIQEAYRVARENFMKGGVNRVILCTDGDFNVGMTDQNQLVSMIQDKAKDGVYLTTLGVGTDNLKDALMQKLADKGNGNYHYLDTVEEGQKVLIAQMNANLITIAKDVKVQVEFNPEKVSGYRLIGYEKRVMRNEDFNNDAKDAGEIGAGHTVTALYEVVPAGRDVRLSVDDLKYQQTNAAKADKPVTTGSKELLTLKLRYKHPEGDKSRLLEFPVTDSGATYAKASTDFKFAAAVASFGMILRNSPHKGSSTYASVQELAGESKGDDEAGYRSEFMTLVKKAQGLPNYPNYQYR